MYLFKDVKKHLSSKQTEGQPGRPRTRLRPRYRTRPRPRPRPRAPSPDPPRLRSRVSSRFTKARRLPFFKYLQLFFVFLFFFLFCFVLFFVFFYRVAISSNMPFFKELQLFLSGYDFSWHLYGESGIRIRSPEWKFLNTLWIRNVWTLNPDIF